MASVAFKTAAEFQSSSSIPLKYDCKGERFCNKADKVYAKTRSEQSQKYKVELLDVWLGSEHTSVISH